MSREAPGTGGAVSVTKGLVGLPLAWTATAVVVSLLQLANVIADLQTARRMGVELPVWRAAADGGSSAAMIILLFPRCAGWGARRRHGRVSRSASWPSMPPAGRSLRWPISWGSA